MSAAPDTAAALLQVAALARKLRETSAHWKRMAADPVQRQKLQEGLSLLDSYRQPLNEAFRETNRTRDLLAKALRTRVSLRA